MAKQNLPIIVNCPQCKKNAPMMHLHDTAHGVEGTHMAGTERYTCTACGHSLTRDEADARGLKYKLDV